MFNEPVNLNVKFNGSYSLFLFILKRYKKELPYNGELKQFALQNNYCFAIHNQWRTAGVGYRAWNLLHKDLTILYLTNKIDVANLNQLKRIYDKEKEYKKNLSITPPEIKYPPEPTDTKSL